MTNTFDAEQRSRLLGGEKEKLAVLILDTDATFAKALATALEVEDIAAVVATDPHDAMDKAKKAGFIAIVLNESIDWNKEIPFWEHVVLQLQQSSTAIYLLADRANARIIGSFHARVKAVFAKPTDPSSMAADLVTYIRDRRVHGEKRKWDRIPFLSEVEFNLDDGRKIETALVLNMSIGGFFVAVPHGCPFPNRGQKARFSIKMLGHTPIEGESTIHWTQTEADGTTLESLRGFGCEFLNPTEDTLSYVCNILNGIRTRQLPKDLLVSIPVKDIATKIADSTAWMESLTVSKSEAATNSEIEVKCFTPILFANLIGLLRALHTHAGSDSKELSIDVSEHNRIVQFKLSSSSSPSTTLENIDRMIPALLMACGGREMLAVHKAGIEFDLGSGARSVLFRMPAKSADQL